MNGQPVDVRKPTRIGDIEDHIKAGSLDITYCIGETGKMKKISRYDLLKTDMQCRHDINKTISRLIPSVT